MRRTGDARSPAEQIGAAGERLLEEPLLLAGFAENHVQHRAVTRMVHRLAAHEFCFSLHVMQTRVHGMALSRASAMGSPQSRHTPYVPLSIRVSASSIACRIFASVCFSLSWMWTSLLPLA